MARKVGKTTRATKAKKKKAKAPRAKSKARSASAGKPVARHRRAAKKRPAELVARDQAAKSSSMLAKAARDLQKAARAAKGRRVVVLFADGVDVPQTKAWQDKPGRWKELRQRYGIEAIVPLFADADVVDQLELHGRKVSPDYPWPRLRNYFRLYLRSAGRSAELVRELLAWKGVVRSAYEDRVAIPAAPASSDLCQVHSRHVDPAPVGIDAASAWQFVGGVGEGQSCIDVESGWDAAHIRLAHLPPARGTLLCGIHELGGIAHGTCVLGTICGTNPIVPGIGQHLGCEGIAPGVAEMRLASYVPESDPPSAQTIYSAVSQGIYFLRARGGGVLLLEFQTADLQPLEVMPAMRDLIESAKPDVIVVEAAGNGNVDLDVVQDDAGNFPLFRPPGAPDSGAIMVGSAHSAVVGGGHHRFVQNRRSGSNFGSRLDCYAWGENIGTPAAGPNDLCNLFGGTSGAAAIIAGVALVVRGLAQAARRQLNAPALRVLLSDPNLGTPCTAGARIGSMPGLAQIVVPARLGPLQLR